MYLGIHMCISTIKEAEVMSLRDSRGLWGGIRGRKEREELYNYLLISK